MKKIINDKKYDTETAECVDSWQYSYPNDFHYVREELYQKKNGEFFLYGEGGAASCYAESVTQNERCGGEAIKPLSDDAAKEWLEQHSDADTYEKLFGPVPE